jgi:ketosteroid isomerase-like protein
VSKIVQQFKTLYNELNKDNLNSIEDIYEHDAIFIDPFHEVHGVDELKNYFANMYENVNESKFEFSESLVNGNSAVLIWTMHLTHKKLNKGKSISVPGATLIRFSEKIHFHHDYFDAGTLIYEHVPVLKHFIKMIKERI